MSMLISQVSPAPQNLKYVEYEAFFLQMRKLIYYRFLYRQNRYLSCPLKRMLFNSGATTL